MIIQKKVGSLSKALSGGFIFAASSDERHY